jgi:UDP-glucose 4-epimerase
LKIVVTGGAGQLGSVFIRKILRERKTESILSIDLKPPLFLYPRCRADIADIRDPKLAELFKGADTVVHLAFVVSRYCARPVFDSINIEGSRNVFEGALSAGVRHVVFASSVAAYGAVPGHPVPLEEDSPRRPQPEFAYAAAKYQVEADLDALERSHPEVAIARVRPGILVGRHMPNLLGTLLRRGLIPETGAPLPVVWDEDVATALVRVVMTTARGAFNLSAAEPLPASALAASLGMHRLPRAPAWLAGPMAQASRAAEWAGLGHSFDAAWLRYGNATLTMNSTRAKDVLGWKPVCATTLEVLAKYRAVSAETPGARLRWFFRLVDLAGRYGPKRVEIEGMHLAIHLVLTGSGGGEFTIRASQGRLLASGGLQPTADATVQLPAVTFLQLLRGEASWTQKQLSGQILAEGQAHAPMVIAGMIAGFRTQMQLPGIAGAATRLVAGTH